MKSRFTFYIKFIRGARTSSTGFKRLLWIDQRSLLGWNGPNKIKYIVDLSIELGYFGGTTISKVANSVSFRGIIKIIGRENSLRIRIATK